MTESERGNQIPKWPLAVIVVAYLVTALAWVILNPQFEGPDEHFHYLRPSRLAKRGVYHRCLSQRLSFPLWLRMMLSF